MLTALRLMGGPLVLISFNLYREFDGKFMKLGLSQLCSTRAPSEAGTHESKSKREAAASETTEVTKEDEHVSKVVGKA